MKCSHLITAYHRLRTQPLWCLLAATNGPVVLGLLQTHLFGGVRSLPASIFYERVERDLEALRTAGEDLPQSAQAYAANWLAAGFLERRFPADSAEEEYELSTAASHAIRFIAGLIEPRTSATESRLAVVIQQLVSLAEETDANPQTRIAALMAERERLDREIESVRLGRLMPLPNDRAIERAREIIALADDLAGDFRRVRDEFEHLNRDMRERVMDHEGRRGDVLQALFAGVDVIGESEAGRTFSAFWRLLTDPEQSAALDQALDDVLSRVFSSQLSVRERRFLLQLTRTLLNEGGGVHDVLQHFARSLKHFVQSREYLEQRRLNQLLKEAQRSALALKEEIKATDTLDYTLNLTGSRLRSLSQWTLHDPSMYRVDSGMAEGEAADVTLEMVGELVAQSEIDFRTLSAHIRALLQQRTQVSIAEVLDRFPAAQGLGSVVGYVALGSRHGTCLPRNETVSWQGQDGQWRKARIPTIYFLKDRAHELV